MLRRFTALYRAVGTREWSFRSIRHFFVTAPLNRGVSAEVVRVLAGHSKLEITQRYAHAIGTDLHGAMARLSKELERGTKGRVECACGDRFHLTLRCGDIHMQIDRARTEAMAEYADAHDALNVMVRLSSAGLHVLAGKVVGSDGARKLGKLVDAVGKTAWNKRSFPAPHKRIAEGRQSLASLALAAAVGAFDWYTIRLVDDLARFSPLGDARGPFAHDHRTLGDARERADARCCRGFAEVHGLRFKLESRVEQLCDHVLTIKRPGLLPLFHFFRYLRNSIVHAGGRADNALEMQAQDASTAQAFAELNKTTSARTPELPVVQSGQVVPVDAEVAILASAICFRIANELDRAAVPLVGEEGLVRMAAHYAVLLSLHDSRSASPRNTSPLKAINWYLGSRLRVSVRDAEEVEAVLGDLQLRKEVERIWDADGRRRG